MWWSHQIVQLKTFTIFVSTHTLHCPSWWFYHWVAYLYLKQNNINRKHYSYQTILIQSSEVRNYKKWKDTYSHILMWNCKESIRWTRFLVWYDELTFVALSYLLQSKLFEETRFITSSSLLNGSNIFYFGGVFWTFVFHTPSCFTVGNHTISHFYTWTPKMF